MIRVALPLLLFSASPALAQAAPVPEQSPLMSMLPLLAIFVVFFFLLIRPQIKQAKLRQAMLEGLKRGDTIVTSGGVVGKINKIVDDLAYVDIGTGSEIKVLKSTITGLYTKSDVVKPMAAADKKNPAVKNDNVGLSKNKVANDN